jgi:hypothetical protein
MEQPEPTDAELDARYAAEPWYACGCCGMLCVSYPGDICHSCYEQAERTYQQQGIVWNPIMGRMAPERVK